MSLWRYLLDMLDGEWCPIAKGAVDTQLHERPSRITGGAARQTGVSILFSTGATTAELSDDDLRMGLFSALEALGRRRKVLAAPPDITRFHSRAGELTRHAREYYGHRLTDVLPATGTHSLMTTAEIRAMFGDLPLELFRTHDWRAGYVTLGETPAAYVREQSGGLADFSWPAQVDKLLVEGDFDLILSIGQVVPHEVSGMANYNKNILVGTGGAEGIHKSHFLSAIYGMERIMGRVENPVRRVMEYASEHLHQAVAGHLRTNGSRGAVPRETDRTRALHRR